MNMKKYFLILIFLLITLSACSNKIEENENGLRVDHRLKGLEYNVEEQAWSAALADTFSDESLKEVQEAYEIALHEGELLSHMPCYCGCGDAGHEHNQHCFVKNVDGNIAYLDQMGFGWPICVDIARAAKQYQDEGYSLEEIREKIDEAYANTGLTPTPTPKP